LPTLGKDTHRRIRVQPPSPDGMPRSLEAHVARNGGRKMPVVVAVAREMLRLMYSVARERRPYTIEPPAARPRVARPTD
jgi:hypothetical protein